MAKNDSRWADVWKRAQEAGERAASVVVPTPLGVTEIGATPAGGIGAVKSFTLAEGPGVYVWMRLSPGTHSFARWFKREVGGHTPRGGGVEHLLGGGGMERGKARARAIAEVIESEVGLQVLVWDVLD